MLVLVNVFCICDGENPPGAGVVDGEVLPPPAGTKFWPASTQKWRHSTEPRCSTSGRFFLGSVAPRCAAVPKDTDLLPGRCPIEGQLECKIFVHEATIWISRPEYLVSGPGSSLKKTPPSRLKSTLPLQKSPFLRFLVNLRKTGSIYKEQKTRKPPFSPPFPPSS